MSEEFTKWVEFSPSRNWIKPEPSRNFGVSKTRIVFYLKGEKGAIQFMIGTEWGVKPVLDHLKNFSPSDIDTYSKPSGWDLGFHSPTPQYEGQELMHEHCHVIDGPCYYDGSALNAEDMVEAFLAGGTDWLWPKLEEVYNHYFNGADYPDMTPYYLPHPDDAN